MCFHGHCRCGNNADSDETAFCSDECAIKMAPELYRALLLARTQLCRALWSTKHLHRSPIPLDGSRASPQMTLFEPPPSDPSAVWGVSLADIQALESRIIKPTQTIGEITGAMERRQLITKMNNNAPSLGGVSKAGLKGGKGSKDNLLVAAESKEQEPGQSNQGETEGLLLLQQLLNITPGTDYPSALASGRASEGSFGGGSASNESPSGAASSPRSSSSSSSSSLCGPSGTSTVPGPGPLAFASSGNPRELARMKFEEIFVASLTRTVTKEASKTLTGQGLGLAATSGME